MEIILITGGAAAGKTWLAKSLQLSYLENSEKPVVIDNAGTAEELKSAIAIAKKTLPYPEAIIITCLVLPAGVDEKIFTRHIHVSRGIIKF